VNFPNLEMPMSAAVRLCVLHANVPAIISQITSALSDEGINIENLTNKSKGNNAYTVLDISAEPGEGVIAKLEAVSDIYRVRVIK
jgi:D-3-phosphoglycerate dehydrogenase